MSIGKYGTLLKNEREKRALTQKALADAAGVTRRAIIHWEKGTRDMTISSADKVFSALGISVTIGLSKSLDDMEVRNDE